MASNSSRLTRTFAILKLAVAIALATSGLNAITSGASPTIHQFTNATGTGSSASMYTYGGDAYTGIQNAAATTANNTLQTNEIMMSGMQDISRGIADAVTITGTLITCFGTFQVIAGIYLAVGAAETLARGTKAASAHANEENTAKPLPVTVEKPAPASSTGSETL